MSNMINNKKIMMNIKKEKNMMTNNNYKNIMKINNKIITMRMKNFKNNMNKNINKHLGKMEINKMMIWHKKVNMECKANMKMEMI